MASSVVAINMDKMSSTEISGFGFGSPRKVIVVPSVCMTRVPEAIVV